jgi:hypothetical protein
MGFFEDCMARAVSVHFASFFASGPESAAFGTRHLTIKETAAH